jgi:predicted nucleic acid-binding protein
MTRYPAHSLLDRIWELRDNLSSYDATYVALAELLDCSLLTADGRLGRAPGLGCPITVVPR